MRKMCARYVGRSPVERRSARLRYDRAPAPIALSSACSMVP